MIYSVFSLKIPYYELFYLVENSLAEPRANVQFVVVFRGEFRGDNPTGFLRKFLRWIKGLCVSTGGGGGGASND